MRLTGIRSLRIAAADLEKFMTEGGDLVVHLRRWGVVAEHEDDRPAPTVPAPVAQVVQARHVSMDAPPMTAPSTVPPLMSIVVMVPPFAMVALDERPATSSQSI